MSLLSGVTRRTLCTGRGVAVGLLLAAAPASAQEWTHPRDMGLPDPAFQRPDPDAMRLTLDNGLTAYVAEDRRAPLLTLTAFLSAGSAHGAPGEADLVGAALRRGPAGMSASDFRARLDAMAAVYTVTVGREETEVTLDVPVEDAAAAVELFADMLRGPRFEESSLSRPGRTQQQSEGGIDWDTSIAGAIAAFESRLYAGHAFGRTPAAAQMNAARDGGAEAFYRSHFVPSNTVLAVAGSLDAAELRTEITRAFGGWRGGERPAAVTFEAIETIAPRRVLTAHADKLQGWVIIGHELPVVPREDEAALHVMDYILGAYHLDSRLFRESRERRGLTNDNSSFLEPGVHGPGSYTMRTYGRPEAVRLLVDVTFRELDTIRETLPDEAEMFVAKGALVDGLYAGRYSTGLAATRSYAIEWLREGSHRGSADYAGRIAGVTAEDVRAAARKYLHPERMIVSVMGPLQKIADAPMIESEPQLDAWGRVQRVDDPGR
jgi:predicted Zn-dependent peptidase